MLYDDYSVPYKSIQCTCTMYITQCKIPLQVTEYNCTLHTIDVYITHCLTSVEVTVYNVLSFM